MNKHMKAKIEINRKVWKESLPVILKELAININLFKAKLSNHQRELFESALPEIRKMYKEVANLAAKADFGYDENHATTSIMSIMMHKLNWWFRQANMSAGIKMELDEEHRKACIAKTYTLIIGTGYISN